MGDGGRRTHPQPLDPLSGCDRHRAEWTLEAAGDPARVVRDPDPKSAEAYIRLTGYSTDAGFVPTVIIDPEDSSGVTAWKTRGADLRHYSSERTPVMTSTSDTEQIARRARHEAIRAEVAGEEAEAAEAEAVEKTSALDVPMHLRIDKASSRRFTTGDLHRGQACEYVTRGGPTVTV